MEPRARQVRPTTMTSTWGSSLTGSLTGGLLSALLTAVGLGPTAPPPVDPPNDCGSLLQWYVDHAIGQVTAYGWAPSRMNLAMRVPAAMDSSTATGTPATGSSPTGTNTQEQGVDEPDVAKTDGQVVVRLVDGRKVVVTDVTGAEPRQVGSWTLPGQAASDGLLLVDHHVLFTADTPQVQPADGFLPGGPAPTATEDTHLYDVDVSVPSSPQLVASRTWSGRLLSLRQYDGTVRLVTSTGLPPLRFVTPGRHRSATQALTTNRALVRSSTLDDWLPRVSDGSRSATAMGCGNVVRPDLATVAPGQAPQTTMVVSLDPTDLTPSSALGVLGSGQDVYSSTDRLYVWGTDWSTGWAARPRTTVLAFALDGATTRYVGTATVAGTARDRWSFDEHDGYLRIAVTWPTPLRHPGLGGRPTTGVGPARATDNGVVVLGEQGTDGLTQVGAVRGLGRGEDVQSVRWFDDLAVLVTYHNTDPVWTVDLSDPAQPRRLGELRLPGFSSYLHPIGDGRLLGLGSDGRDHVKASLLDLADPTRVTELDSAPVASDAGLDASYDPHAFTWLASVPGAGSAIAQVTPWDGRRPRLVQIEVGEDGRLTVRPLPSPGGYAERALPLPDGRVALVGDRVLLTRVG